MNSENKDNSLARRKEKKKQQRELNKKKYSIAGKDVINTLKEIITGKKVITNDNEYIKEYYTLSGTTVSKHSPYTTTEITIVSTSIELGQNISTSFGLFFLLLHRTSVLRRPKEMRTPHFLWIDECAQYVHPFFDDVIALYRQYRVAAVLTLQTLTQLEKHNATAYLKNVFLGAGTHIVFGRLATEEMKLYSEMAGITRELQEQKTQTSNSVLASNPNYSESVRVTPTITNNMEGADMRILDFLELTIFTVDNGRVLPGQFGRVFFIGSDAYDTQKTKVFLWEKAVPEAFRENVDITEEAEEQQPIEFEDEILSDAQEQLLIKAVPKEEYLEENEKDDMSLNELYQILLSGDIKESRN